MSARLTEARHDRRRAHAAVAAMWLFGTFFLFMVLRVPVAFALGLACLPVLFIEPRLSPMVDLQHDVQGLQLVHPARGAVLPAHREPDECRRHHRPAGHAVANDGGQLSGRAGADQRAAVGVLRRHLGIVDRRRGEPGQDLHRGAGQGRLRPLVLDRDHRRFGRAGRDHPALDPDGGMGRRAVGVDRRALSRRRHPGTAASVSRRWPPCTSMPRSATTRPIGAPP